MHIVFDIGGTNLRVACTDLKRVWEVTSTPTPVKYEDGIKQLIDLARQLAAGEPIYSIAGGLPGVLDKQNQVLEIAPHLPDWNQQRVAADITKALNCRVFLQNDTALLGLGEANQLALFEYEIVAFIGIGTGYGGARIVSKKIDEGANSFEPGHQLLNHNGELSSLESFVSGSGIWSRYGAEPKLLVDANAWREIYSHWALGVYNTIVHWSPDALVFGGGLIHHNALQLPRLEQELLKLPTILKSLPPMVKGQLGDAAGLVGAMYYLSQKLQAQGETTSTTS